MSSPTGSNTWQDRRALFQNGKVLHEPAPKVQYYKPSSPISSPTAAAAAAAAEGSTANRRRSSTSSSQGMFGNLMQHKRGSEDYSQRRASIDEMTATKGKIGTMMDKFMRPQK